MLVIGSILLLQKRPFERRLKKHNLLRFEDSFKKIIFQTNGKLLAEELYLASFVVSTLHGPFPNPKTNSIGASGRFMDFSFSRSMRVLYICITWGQRETTWVMP